MNKISRLCFFKKNLKSNYHPTFQSDLRSGIFARIANASVAFGGDSERSCSRRYTRTSDDKTKDSQQDLL
jgi:hypothetical protein